MDFHILKMKLISSKRLRICKEALSWIGTPYQHQAMVKGKDGAVDCAMLIAGVALNIGLVQRDDLKDIPNYPKEWHLHQDIPMLTDIMKSFGCEKKKSLYAHPADIIVFKIGRVPSHLGIMLENNKMIHAFGGANKQVVVNEFGEQWKKRLVEVYRFPGL